MEITMRGKRFMERIPLSVKEHVLYLDKGSYCLDLEGGFYVRSNGFRISVRRKDTSDELLLKEYLLKLQLLRKGRRVKRMYKLMIHKEGEYLIRFHNPLQLQVKKINLPVLHNLFATLPLSDIRLAILKKS